MTYESASSNTPYEGNGSATSFPTGFKFLANDQVKAVVRIGGLDADLVEDTDYTLTGAGEDSGGTLVFPIEGSAHHTLASGERLVIYLDPPIVQDRAIGQTTMVDLPEIEKALDQLTMICASLDEKVSRVPQYPPSSTAEEIGSPEEYLAEIAAQRAGAETAQGLAETAQGLAEDARDAAESAAASVDGTALDELRTLLLAEALRRAIGDSVDGREFLGNGWIDPLADAGEVAVTLGSFVSTDGGYLTNAGAEDQVTSLDLTLAQFLDEKGGVTTLTVDTANTSGHFNTAKPARVTAGCRMVIGGVSYIIASISGDGTAANSVVFVGTLSTGDKTVSGIYGCEVDGTSIRLNRAWDGSSYGSNILTGGAASAVSAAADGGANLAVDNNTGTFTYPTSPYNNNYWWQYDCGSGVTRKPGKLRMYKGSRDGIAQWELRASNTGDFSGEQVVLASGTFTSTVGWQELAFTPPEIGYRYFRLYGLSLTSAVQTGRPSVYELELLERAVVYPTGVYPLSLTTDCADWTALKALARTETLNSQNIWYALSFDGGTTYSAFVSSAWLPIVRVNAGTWEYWTGSAWAASAISSALGAMIQAAAVAGNQMTGATMAGLSQAQIEGSGGFAPGQASLPVLAALYSASAGVTPVLSAMSMTSDILAHDMVAEFDTFEAVDPDQAKVALVLQAVDDVTLDQDLKAWVKRGEGVYAQVPLVVDSAFDAQLVLVVGGLDLGGSGTGTQLKLTCHNHKELRVHAAANHFKSS